MTIAAAAVPFHAAAQKAALFGAVGTVSCEPHEAYEQNAVVDFFDSEP